MKSFAFVFKNLCHPCSSVDNSLYAQHIYRLDITRKTSATLHACAIQPRGL